MASVGPSEHKQFCKIDDWQELKSARGKRPDHDRYRKTLANGDILTTKVSRNKKQYGDAFWRHIWREQLGLESEDEFWEALQTGKPVPRKADAAPPERPTITAWLVERLTYTVGVPPEEIAQMSPEEAEQRWEAFQRGERS